MKKSEVEMHQVERSAAPAPRWSVEEWAKQKQIPGWKFVVAKAHEQWPVGLQVTEEEFEAAVDAACHAPLR